MKECVKLGLIWDVYFEILLNQYVVFNLTYYWPEQRRVSMFRKVNVSSNNANRYILIWGCLAFAIGKGLKQWTNHLTLVIWDYWVLREIVQG